MKINVFGWVKKAHPNNYLGNFELYLPQSFRKSEKTGRQGEFS